MHTEKATDVERCLRALLAAEGWRETDQPLADEESWGLGGPRRGIIVCKPTGEWTPVIDSAALVSDIPVQLSDVLQTSVFNVHVHDSDFWMYALYRRGELIDQFASMDMNDYFGGETFGEDPSMMGSGSVERTLDERWEVLFDYLAEGVSRKAFDQAMQLVDPTARFDAMVMGEEGLGRFFTLLGVDSSLAYLSYRYWMEDPGDDSLQEHSHLLLEEG